MNRNNSARISTRKYEKLTFIVNECNKNKERSIAIMAVGNDMTHVINICSKEAKQLLFAALEEAKSA